MTAKRSSLPETNIDPGALPRRLAESALPSAPNPTEPHQRWVAVRARRPAVKRVDPEVVLESECAVRNPQMLPLPACDDAAARHVGEPAARRAGVEILPAPAGRAEPLGHETTAGSMPELRGTTRLDRVAPSSPRLLPEGTHALRIVMRSSNGRRRWALEVLVRQPST
jgi:hypothetical protein